MPDDNLPDVDDGKQFYLLRRETIEALKTAIRTNKPVAVTNGGLQTEESDDGVAISLS
jgi:hypothetical protein